MSLPTMPGSRFLELARALRIWFVRFFGAYSLNGTSFLLLLSVFIGLGGALGAVGFRWLIGRFTQFFMGDIKTWLGHPYLVPVIPAFGGLLVGIIVIRWAREARGAGVPEVMAAVATQNGRIRARVVALKTLASALCIGSGGSAGREGPIVQIGSALGSGLGQVFRLSSERLKVLVGCGAAAGISATFNAPLAGGIFALEVILGDFTINTFSPILLSSVLANAFTHYMVGDTPAFIVPAYRLVHISELGLYAGLAVLSGIVAVAFLRLIYRMEDLFERLPVSEYARPVAGGAMVGGIGIFYPEVFGVGYETISETLLNPGNLRLVGILLVAKVFATAFTLGSGGSGGIFAPSLFVGAMLGGVYGDVVNGLFPESTGQPGAYALVGMGAVVAGTTHAPLSAMLILFELTDDYLIILPLMLATILSTLTAKGLERESIYTLKLARRGLRVSQGVDVSVLDSIRVREAMTTGYDYVRMHTPLGEIVELLQHSDLTDFPVVDEAGRLKGVVSFQDIRSVITDNEMYSLLIAADIVGGVPPAVAADASLSEAMDVFAENDVYNLPVVADAESYRLVGVITRARLMGHYNQELHRRTDGR